MKQYLLKNPDLNPNSIVVSHNQKMKASDKEVAGLYWTIKRAIKNYEDKEKTKGPAA